MVTRLAMSGGEVKKRGRIGRPRLRLSMAVIVAVLVMSIPSKSNGDSYTGFRLLKEECCKQIDTASLAKLPAQWQRYSSFVKVCPLQPTSASVAKISVVSVWVNEYFETRFAGRPRKWENFPRPIIVDADMAGVGTLPELYPNDDITSSNLFYGKWMSGIPTEIRIDVSNPAEGGDYYYKPLLWNEKSHRYHIVDMEIVDGTRK